MGREAGGSRAGNPTFWAPLRLWGWEAPFSGAVRRLWHLAWLMSVQVPMYMGGFGMNSEPRVRFGRNPILFRICLLLHHLKYRLLIFSSGTATGNIRQVKERGPKTEALILSALPRCLRGLGDACEQRTPHCVPAVDPFTRPEDSLKLGRVLQLDTQL